MLTESVLAELLERACPTIQYRLRWEVLGEPRSAPHLRDLHSQILNDAAVQEVFSWQQSDGWLGWNFHGDHSLEAGIRLLCEKGVDPHHSIIANELHALERETDRLDRGIGKVGRILDDRGLGGSQTIRAAVFAYTGIEDKPFVREQIDRALAAFNAVLTINAIDDLVQPYKSGLVYRLDHLWPCIYHLRLLAFTRSWRSAENRRLLIDSVQRLIDLSPLPSIHVRHKSQLIAPASFCMNDFSPVLSVLDDAHWMMWFHRMELLARLGVVRAIPALTRQIAVLRETLAAGQGRFMQALSHAYFRKWGAYTGLMLERDWRDPQRRIYDLTFRSLLILHYAQMSCPSASIGHPG
ncbi:hypothetical protein TFLX_00911 [Thermoflexales bacterium]|nr:hypothetical protein TFLX_00911 [Thermoflexales bacterium]